MKILPLDWSSFMAGLEQWQRVPPSARRIFLEFVQPALPFTAEAASEAIPFLLDAGILTGGQGRSSTRVSEEHRVFARVMRVLYRYPVFDPAHPVSLAKYLTDHFSFEERAAFGAGGLHDVAAAVGARSWLEAFLESPDPAEWERAHARSSSSSPTGGAAESARELVRMLLKRRRPMEIRELLRLDPFAGNGQELLGEALSACFRTCLLFPGLRSQDLEPVVGVWPAVVQGRRRKVAPLEAAEPERSFRAPLLVHDMTAVLVECSASPLPVRRTDLGLFSRSVNELSALLYPLPAWCDGVVAKTPSTRLRAAQLFLHAAGFVAVGSRRGSELSVTATEPGRRWLAQPMKQKLLDVFRLFRTERAPDAGDHRLEFLPSPPAFLLLSGRLDLRSAVVELFRDLEDGRYVEYREFLRRQSQRVNPYVELRRQGVRMSVRGLDGYREPTKGELEEQWERLIERFLAQRLLVLDAVSLGLTAERRLCFALTDAGRCLLGLADDFEYGPEGVGRIIVQPNFEVVFLAASARAEADIGRYAERIGREVGTLFRITKRSVLRAAAGGLRSEEVLGSLSQHAAGTVPGNVASEIEGWFRQCRTVRMETVLLIRCPDAETTSRVAAAGGKLVRVLSDTALEVAEPRRRGALERMLGEDGIFVELAPERGGPTRKSERGR